MESGKNQITEAGSLGHGDMIHVKLPGGSWWPAQVVNDEAILQSFQPRKCRTGEVLVRIYGSQEFLNVNPVRSCSEFELILKNNNADLRKILEEGLQKDLPSSKNKPASKAKGMPSEKTDSKSKSNKKVEEQTPAKRQKQNKESKDGDLASPSCETTASGKLQELSSRRIRVMQSLGLVAPLGSPFTKDRRNCNKIP
ncbi:putative PWWP domain-containing protein [Medicago truncatula]|nr:uncharacterized protein LOC11429832 isoform X1 [Medicago truncatula]AES73176.2 PWWP domain protein [Medicago truncatula]RHN70204.1 putative PWWP domain-containing protein [Medicago truncatula]